MHDATKRLSARPQLALAARRSSLLVAVLLLACACATPIGVTHVDTQSMEGVASEKIVRSSHSTQSMPATILEVRRILYEHLGIACGLECEVPARVEAAMTGALKPEPPAGTTDPAPKP